MKVDHNDYELLTQQVDMLDSEGAAGLSVDEITGGIVDPDSLGVVAADRALKVASAESTETFEDIATIAAATWLEGFVIGARFRKGRT